MTFIISELSNQWGGSKAILNSLLLQSAMFGADAAKIQLFANDWNVKRLNSSGNDYLSVTYSLYDWFRFTSLSHSIVPIASPFDEERLSWVLEDNSSIVKIGFGVFRDRRKIADLAVDSGHNVIISLDPSHIDISQKPYGSSENVSYLLTSRKYPTLLEQCWLPTNFKDTIFDGYSDHCAGISACLLAVARGASTLEKHFTFSRTWQKSGEMAHFGSADTSDLHLLRSLERDFRLLGSENHTYF
jgi:sialic acid synthase SpsE